VIESDIQQGKKCTRGFGGEINVKDVDGMKMLKWIL
jgi:hypothetical protein